MTAKSSGKVFWAVMKAEVGFDFIIEAISPQSFASNSAGSQHALHLLNNSRLCWCSSPTNVMCLDNAMLNTRSWFSFSTIGE